MDEGPSVPGRVESGSGSRPGARVLAIALALVVGVAICGWLALAFAHLHDRFNVNTVSGAWLALAERARDGVLYPPLFDGQSYAGTRNMPLPIVLYAAAISLGGGLIAPAKLVDFAAALGLAAVFVAVLTRLGAGRLLAAALLSTVITSQVFLLTGTGIRPEALPTALQLGAVALVAFSTRRRAVAAAGLASAVAIFCKISALWAPITIVIWLLARRRHQLPLYAVVFAVASGALLLFFNFASDGRMVADLVELGGAGLSMSGVLRSPLKTVELLSQNAQASIVLLPAALLGFLSLGQRARTSIFSVSLLAAVLITLVVMADAGSDYNHLLDCVVLLPIVAFEVVDSAARRVRDTGLLWLSLGLAVIVGSSVALASNMASDLAAIAHVTDGSHATYDPQPLATVLRPGDSLLSEDPYVPLSRGETPVVGDPFMLVRIGQRQPDLVDPLLAEIDQGQFDVIVLNEDLDLPGTAGWFAEYAFGEPIYVAIRQHYRLCSATDGYFLYVALGHPCGTAPG